MGNIDERTLFSDGPWSERMAAYQARVRQDVRRIVLPRMRDAAQKNLFPREIVKQFAEQGHLRERWCTGGEAGDLGRAILLPYEIGYGSDGAIGLGLSLHHETVTSVLARERPLVGGVDVFEKAIGGDLLFCVAMTEPETGSDYLALSTTAHRQDGGWRILGRKKFISLAMTADMALVFARTGSDARVSTFLVPKEGPHGYKVLRKLNKMGTHSIETCEIALDNVWVSDDHVVGRLHRGVQTFTLGMTCERLSGAALALGIFRSSLEIARSYLRQRKTRGGVAWDYQALRHKFADLLAEQSVLWKTLLYTGWAFERGICDERDVVMLKLRTIGSVERGISDALQLLGGTGYIDEFPLERHLRDVRLGRIGGGTDEVMRNLVAGTPISDGAYEDWLRYRADRDREGQA